MSDEFFLDDFEQVGPRLGSNPGGTYRNKHTGELFYLKFPSKIDIARNEVLAAKLYELAGVRVPKVSFITDHNGNLGVASKIELTFKSAQDPKNFNLRTDVKWSRLPGVQEGLSVDAWLANWDVVGLEYDNIGTYTNPDTGKLEALRLDMRGSLVFRAQGAPKGHLFGTKVGEIDSLQGKDPKVQNSQAADVFGRVPDGKIIQGVSKITNISNDAIKTTVEEYGPGTARERQQLATKLIARKDNLEERFGVEVKKTAP